MTQEKKMYVVFCEDSEKYWCSYNTWSDQLRKATIFHSTKYVNEVHKRFKELRLKNVEVRMEVVPEKPTNADRIRGMSDEELADFLSSIAFEGDMLWADQFIEKLCKNCPTITCTVEGYDHQIELNECDFVDGKCPHGSDVAWWLQQPAEEAVSD